MAEVLVLVDHVDGTPKKVSYELLTLARTLGEPSAVVLGKGASAAADKLAAYGAEKVYVCEAEEIDAHLRAPRPRCSPSSSAPPPRWRCWSPATPRARRSRARLAVKTGERPDHRRGRPVDRARRRAADLRRQRRRAVQGRHRHAGHHRPPQLHRPGGAGRCRHRRAGLRDLLRRRQGGPHRRARRGGQGRAPGARRRLRRRLGWPRRRQPGELLDHREARRQPRRGRRRLARRDRRRLVPAPEPGRPDRPDRLAAALRRGRHLRRDPAPRRHADLEDHRGHQQGPRGADLRARRLRPGGRPQHGRPRAHRGDPARKG